MGFGAFDRGVAAGFGAAAAGSVGVAAFGAGIGVTLGLGAFRGFATTTTAFGLGFAAAFFAVLGLFAVRA